VDVLAIPRGQEGHLQENVLPGLKHRHDGEEVAHEEREKEEEYEAAMARR
jgi:hypothetical protein